MHTHTRSHPQLPFVHRFVPDNAALRPAYFVATDHEASRIIWGIRGTKSIHDVLTDVMGSACEVAPGRHAHEGMLQVRRLALMLAGRTLEHDCTHVCVCVCVGVCVCVWWGVARVRVCAVRAPVFTCTALNRPLVNTKWHHAQAARELIRLELPEVLKLSGQLPGFEIQIVGHSLGEMASGSRLVPEGNPLSCQAKGEGSYKIIRQMHAWAFQPCM